MPGLFEPIELRDVTVPNRIAVSPMCQYTSVDGMAEDWHLVHLGSRAVGGAGLVFTEATAVLPEGRISPWDLGLWNDTQIDGLARITRFIREQGAVPGIQLAHAGRKASTYRPWDAKAGGVPGAEGGWQTVAPSPGSFADGYPMPRPLDLDGIDRVIQAFAAAAARALEAGFKVVEVHAAHGYLINQFLSPLSNRREDKWGGSFDHRVRLLREVVARVRTVWPDRLPVIVRISATDWHPDGWTVDDSVALARLLAHDGVDLIDCSSGGNVAGVKIPVGPGYQTAFAERIRREAGLATGTVGMIVDPAQADHVIRSGQADLVLLARELLRDPYWPLRAARTLGAPASWPEQYLRAGPAGAPRRAPADLPLDP
ncbi:MAG: NADH:flavin oxidoreductase/NADH oxidase [Gemmatimonadales bacterium]